MSERISNKQWGVDLYTTEQLEIKIDQLNRDISEYKYDTPLTRCVKKMRDAFVKELATRQAQQESE